MLAQAPPAAQPNQRIFVPRPDAPPHSQYNVQSETEDFTGKTRHLVGKAKIETDTSLLEADDIEYNVDTHDLRGTGHVHYHNFARNEELWAERVQYNTDSETGTFYQVSGKAMSRIDARPGLLTSNEPFFFQGEWAERMEDRYILHNGFITNCKMPNPWWELRGPKFDIIPGDRAIAYRSVFWVRKLPLFFTPYFYKSLEKVPRRSGFLLPTIGNSTLAGPFIETGYFWAINRSYDLTYRLTEYFERGENHYFEFRGKPRTGTDFDAIIYALDDRVGITQGTGPNGMQLPNLTFSGLSANIAGKSDLGDGWTARGQFNYLTSFRFRLNWTQSWNEAIGSEVHSTGYVNKSWSDYTLNIVAARLENYQTAEVPLTNPVTGATSFETNAVIIRKLPEVDFSEREHQVWQAVPLWVSFDSSAGLLSREEPLFSPTSPTVVESFQTSQLMQRVNVAPHVMTSLRWGDFHIVPRFGIDETYYSQGQTLNPQASQAYGQPAYQVVGSNLVRSARDLSVDFLFPSLARVFDKKTIFGDKLKHVIEPRVTYKYVTGIGTDFNNFIRFDDTDLLANTNELDLSLTNRIYAKRGAFTDEILTWQLQQARYFDPTFGGALVPGQRNVFLSTAELSPFSFLTEPRSTSPVVSTLTVYPVRGLGIEWRADYDHRRGEITDSSVSLDYRWARYFVSVGHNLVNTDPILIARASQYRFRFGFGDLNHRGWNAGVDGIYDAYGGLNHTGALEYATTQVTYNTDCCGISVQYRLFNVGPRNDSQFRVSFSIANLGSFGTLRRQDRIF